MSNNCLQINPVHSAPQQVNSYVDSIFDFSPKDFIENSIKPNFENNPPLTSAASDHFNPVRIDQTRSRKISD
jgi:hypothetical protein